MKRNKHFRRIPDYIEQELLNIQSRHVIVAAIINASLSDIARGEYKNLGIKASDGVIEKPDIIYPDELVGLYARRNRNGIVWVHKDLPKITKTYLFESPNFGDYSKGTHTTFFTREVYQRSFEPPRDWEIALTMLNQDKDFATIKVELVVPLDRTNPDFRKDLFFAVNLLQEQCHDCHVFDIAVTDEELSKITVVGWEIFPPGTIERTYSIFTGKLRDPSPIRQREIEQRINVLNSFHPTEYINGVGMNSHYFGAKFGENIVAFENVDYGNALYILFDNWQEISKMSRIDILKRHERDFIRIIHKEGWERVLKRHLDELKRLS